MLQARMRQPVFVLPDAMTALQSLSKVADKSGVPAETLGLVHLRASQINGCSVCCGMQEMYLEWHDVKETPERMLTVAAWRDAPWFTDAERAALALTEAVTRIADREDPVPDALWDEVSRHYDEKQLSGLLLAIAAVNVWNRLNLPTRQVAGDWKG